MTQKMYIMTFTENRKIVRMQRKMVHRTRRTRNTSRGGTEETEKGQIGTNNAKLS
jgi:hypothetical protein